MRELLTPCVEDLAGAGLSDELLAQLATFLTLLVRWNARTNLTAVRDPEAMVVRHLGESLFAGRCLVRWVPVDAQVLDLGSGAGIPGIPVQLLLPQLRVTLAESQGKKAAFLREAVRVLGLQTEVWAGRAEAMPADRCFDAVMLRAVDRMQSMRVLGQARLRAGGVLLEMVGAEDAKEPGKPGEEAEVYAVPGRHASVVRLSRVLAAESDVPRGT